MVGWVSPRRCPVAPMVPALGVGSFGVLGWRALLIAYMVPRGLAAQAQQQATAWLSVG